LRSLGDISYQEEMPTVVMATARRTGVGSSSVLFIVIVVLVMMCTLQGGVHAGEGGKSVSVSVRAKWKSTSLLLEAG
jgi:hypothetical protein